MAVITEKKIDQIVRESLRQRGVLGQLDGVDLFLTPEGVLAEVVLRDASALEQARQAVQDAESKLEGEGVSLLPTVRALWEVDGVEKIETSNPPGVPLELLGALFKGTLKSGERHQEVWVAVTPSAQQVLRPLGSSDQALADLVRAFLRHQLSIGGAGYWDPIREPRQELEGNAARYLRWRPYAALKSSIDDIFNPRVSNRKEQVASFVRSMKLGARRVHDFQAALTDLPQPGGAFAPGERLVTSNYEMYDMLLDAEKRELESYYSDQVRNAEKDFPELKSQFPAVFN